MYWTPKVKGSAKPVLGWSQFMQLYKDVDDSTIDARTQAVKPGHCAVLVYTSGTTGEPKAVMLLGCC